MMRMLSLVVAALALVVLLQATPASGKPTALGFEAGQRSVAQGPYVLHALVVKPDEVRRAAEIGYLDVPFPDGRVIRVEHRRWIEHAGGHMTWVGEAGAPEGPQQALITIGPDAVFGRISVGSGEPPVRLVGRSGRAWLMETTHARLRAHAAKIGSKPGARMIALSPDTLTPVESSKQTAAPVRASALADDLPIVATPTPVIDVLVAYTTSLSEALGSRSAAETRIHHLVDLTNEAFINSEADVRLRLVRALEVDYPDDTSVVDAVIEIGGLWMPDKTYTDLAPGLRTLGDLRLRLGVDLVGLVRPFRNPEHAGCGAAWVAGKNLSAPISEGFDGFVVSDGMDEGVYCEETGFAHQIGLSLGQYYDPDTAGGETGAHVYSAGHRVVSGEAPFSTIMAPSYGDVPVLNLFSNPRIDACRGQPCGVEGVSDNARSLGQVARAIAMRRSDPTGSDWRTVESASGYFDLELSPGAVPSNAGFATTPLARVVEEFLTREQDDTPDDPYDEFPTEPDAEGVLNFPPHVVLDIPADYSSEPEAYRVIVEADSGSSLDVDLFAGSYTSVIGEPVAASLPKAALEGCSDRREVAKLRCEFTHTAGPGHGSVWVHVQNRHASDNAADPIRVSVVAIPMTPRSDTLIVTAPGQVEPTGITPLRVQWRDPGFAPGERRMGYVLILDADGVPVSTQPVQLQRIGSNAHPVALQPGVPTQVTLADNRLPGSIQDLIFFDVPPHATEVRFQARETEFEFADFTLSAVRVGTASGPGLGAAPDWTQAKLATATDSATRSLVLTGADLEPGRWVLRLVSTALEDRHVEVAANLQVSAAAAPAFESGHYYNPGRSGHGAFVDFAGDQWVMVWYTYLQDSTPTWYYTQGLAPGADSVWTAPLYRVVWNGSGTLATDVGDVTLTPTGTRSMVFTYTLDGETGTEPMVRLGGGGCPLFAGQRQDVTGHWYSPSKSGFGYSLQLEPTTEVIAAYVYDGFGQPRWLIGQQDFAQSPSGNLTVPLKQLSGFCPLCEAVPVDGPEVGTLSRQFLVNGVQSIGVQALFRSPLVGSWQESLPVAMLSVRKGCR